MVSDKKYGSPYTYIKINVKETKSSYLFKWYFLGKFITLLLTQEMDYAVDLPC